MQYEAPTTLRKIELVEHLKSTDYSVNVNVTSM